MSLPKLCALCRCDATTTVFGFAVCPYHAEHGEGEPSCPTCNHPREPALTINGLTPFDEEARVARATRVPTHVLPEADVQREALAIQHELRLLHDRLDALSTRLERRSSLRDTVRDLTVTTEIAVDRLRVDMRLYPA